MVIQSQHIIYGPDLKPVTFSTDAARSRFNGSHLVELRAGGNDWYLYQPPEYDPDSQKPDGVLSIEGVYVYEGVVPLSEDEMAQRGICRIDAELLTLDAKATRGVEDLVNDLVSTGKIAAIPPELSTTIARKEELRAARMALADGVITEQEAVDLDTTKTGFWAWLGGLFT